MDSARLRPTVRQQRRRFFGGLLACCAAMAAGAGPAQGKLAAATLERKIKAAFLYKFLGYTEYPAGALGEPGAPLVIGVLGADELAAELAAMVAGRSAQGRPIAVKPLRESDAPVGLHLLYVGGNDVQRARSVFKAAAPGPMLLVSDMDNGLRQGAVINFLLVEQRVRFDVSLEAAERNGIKLSSRLLTVANLVHKGGPA